MFFISFSRNLPLDEFFYVAKSFQILQNQYNFSMILFRIIKNWRFEKILQCLKWFCYIENLIEWQNLRKAYKKQTLKISWISKTYKITLFPKLSKFINFWNSWLLKISLRDIEYYFLSELLVQAHVYTWAMIKIDRHPVIQKQYVFRVLILPWNKHM